MNTLTQSIIDGLPLHFQKETLIKLCQCIDPCIEYIDFLIEDITGQTSIQLAKGIFLDYYGLRYQESRKIRNDDDYRKALMLKKYSRDTLPTTEFLLELTRSMSGKEVTKMETRYKNEVASQYFRIAANQDFNTINLMPNLNMVCEAGARMVWDIELSSENAKYYYNSVIGKETIMDIEVDFIIDQTLNIPQNYQYNSIIDKTKIINIGGINI